MNEACGGRRRRRAEDRARLRLSARTQPPVGTDPAWCVETEAVRAALSRLPRRQREVTVLRYFLGLSTAEIADTLHVDPGTVKTCLYRARHALAATLGDGDDTKEVHYA